MLEQSVRGDGWGVSRANDSEIPVQHRYSTSPQAVADALERWGEKRAAAGPPFRPRFMVYSGLGTPDMTAARLRLLQDLGAESFLLAADLPSQLGLDPDDELAHAQVGRAGVSCATLDDFRRICADLDLPSVDSIGMLANSVGHVGLGMVATVLEDRDAGQVKLVMQNDPLKEFTARGTEIHSPEQALRIACDCVAYAIDRGMAGYPITVCSNHYDVAGAGPIVGVAMALANAIAYADELVRRGYHIADVSSRMMFFLNERSDLFIGASVFRTGRVVWSEILADRYGLGVEDQPVATMMGYAHGLETSEEPLVNVARCAVSIVGSVLGGVDYLCASAYDEALRVPSVDAAALALRTMQVVGIEHGVASTVDALAGSQKLIDVDEHVYRGITEALAGILESGGAVECIHNGYMASLIDRRRGTREGQLATGERAWVGVNTYIAPQYGELFAGRSVGEIDFQKVEREMVEGIVAHRRSRDQIRLTRNLLAVERAAAGSDNLVPATIDALKAGATVQELVSATDRGFEERVVL